MTRALVVNLFLLLALVLLVFKLIRRLFKLIDLEEFFPLCIVTGRIQKGLCALIRFELKTRRFGRSFCV